MEDWEITMNQEVSNEVCSDLVAELWKKMKKRNTKALYNRSQSTVRNLPRRWPFGNFK